MPSNQCPPVHLPSRTQAVYAAQLGGEFSCRLPQSPSSKMVALLQVLFVLFPFDMTSRVTQFLIHSCQTTCARGHLRKPSANRCKDADSLVSLLQMVTRIGPDRAMLMCSSVKSQFMSCHPSSMLKLLLCSRPIEWVLLIAGAGTASVHHFISFHSYFCF